MHLHRWLESFTLRLAKRRSLDARSCQGWSAVNVPDRPRERADAAAREPELAEVIPFPRGGRDGRNHHDVDWTFTTDVRWVDGAEGDWLRKELAGVVRELLVWASDDMTNSEGEEPGEERWAA